MATATRRVNGRAAKTTSKKRRMVPNKTTVRPPVQLLGGIFLPAFVYGMAKLAGACWQGGDVALAFTVGLVGVAMLAVSLSHVAFSCRDLFQCSKWQSWAMAIAIDAGLIVSEVAEAVGYHDAQLIVIAVVVASMAANVWAFWFSRE